MLSRHQSPLTGSEIVLESRGGPDLAVIDEQLVKNECRPHVRAGDRWLDIGGFIGAFTVMVAEVAQSVTVYEPFASSYRLLEKNVQLNERKNVTSFCSAVGDVDGRGTLYWFPDGKNSRHSTVEVPGARAVSVDQIGIVGALRASRANKIKIDVEGAERLIVGALGARDLDGLDEVIVEFHPFRFGGEEQLVFEELTGKLDASFGGPVRRLARARKGHCTQMLRYWRGDG